jgi:hypothetical protein
MNPLQNRLAALRRRLRLVVTFRGSSWLATILFTAIAVVGLLDWRLHLGIALRISLLTGTLTVLGYVAYRLVVWPLATGTDDLHLALRLEKLYPSFNDSLASAVQFMEAGGDAKAAGSWELRAQTIQEAIDSSKEIEFARAVDARGLRAGGLSLVGSASLAVALAVAYPQFARTALIRFADPFGSCDWPRQTELEIRAPSRVATGEWLEVEGSVSGLIPTHATVVYSADGTGFIEQKSEIGAATRNKPARFVARIDTSQIHEQLRFRVQVNDAVSPWHDVAVLPPPRLVPLEGRSSPQIRLDYPAYTGLRARDLPDGTTTIEAPAGTRVMLRAATDRPIARAWLDYPDELNPILDAISFASIVADPSTIRAPKLILAYERPWKRIPARLTSGGQTLEIEFLARVSGTFAFHFEDESGLGSKRLVELQTVDDPPPIVRLERPRRDSFGVLSDAEVALEIYAQDTRYAVRSVFLECHRKTGEVEAPPQYLVLCDPSTVQSLVPFLSFILHPSSLILYPPSLPPSQELAIRSRWSLSPLALKEGDVLTIRVCADDFDNVTVNKKPGGSHELELRVIGRTGLELALNESEAMVQQELVRLHKEQAEALHKIREVEGSWGKDKVQPQDLIGNLLQAEQVQQQIRSRLGNSQQGLVAQVAGILDTMRGNHLPFSSAQERMQAVQAELARLARENLEQLESLLTQARKQAEIETVKTPAAGAWHAPLLQARRHQEEVERTLSDLLKLLEPWSSTLEAKGEARAILQDQLRLMNDTAGLAKEIPSGARPAELGEAQNAELARAAELQTKLAERASKNLDKLRNMASSRIASESEAARQLLTDAADRGQAANAPAKMRQAARSIVANNLAQAGIEQRQSADATEEVVKALEERRPDDLDRLVKKLKASEKKLDQLTRAQERLREEMRQADQLVDSANRQETLQRLVREQEELENAVREVVRELSRLQAQEAGEVLGEAPRKMQQAAEEEQPALRQQRQEEALDQLNATRDKLEQKRRKAEDELAREKSQDLAGQVKGLRRRQQALNAEAERVHRELLERKQWTRALLVSLGSLADAQRDLGNETVGLARNQSSTDEVRCYLLRKSSASMKRAAESMEESKNQAVQRASDSADSNAGLDLAAEGKVQIETHDLQASAVRRLDQLLEALNPRPETMKQMPPQAKERGRPSSGEIERAQESQPLPSPVELRLLLALQQEVHERTRAFGKLHAEGGKLSAEETEELNGIRKEQQELADLFYRIATPAERGR